MPIKLTNQDEYSLSIAAWLADDDYDRRPVKGPYISATELLKPIRMIILSNRAFASQTAGTISETIDISRFVPSKLGTAVHSGIEHTWTYNYKNALRALGYPPSAIDKVKVNPQPDELQEGDIPVYMEQRAIRKVGKYSVGGKFDFVGNGTLEDFKSMGVYAYMKGDKDEEQMLQGSIYRWLNPDIITSDHMLIQQIFTDWSKLDATVKQKRGYPSQRILSKKLMLMSIEDTQKWIEDKIALITLHENTPEPDLPYCLSTELWQSDPVYKYYKNPNSTKRSTANFDNYHEAHDRYIKDGSVGVVRETLGAIRRCNYCSAFELCTQKDQYIASGLLQPL